MILWEYFLSSFVNLWEENSKCEVSLRDSQMWGITKGLFKSEVSAEDCKRCFDPKVQDDWLEPYSNCITWRLVLEVLN